jgi:hypothetical protein
MTRVKVENVMDNNWFHQLLTNGCPFDAIGLIASTASALDLAGFTARRSDEKHRFASFQYDRRVQKVDASICRWNLAQLPEVATFLATLLRSFHAILIELPVVPLVQVVGYTPQGEVFVLP